MLHIYQTYADIMHPANSNTHTHKNTRNGITCENGSTPHLCLFVVFKKRAKREEMMKTKGPVRKPGTL